MDDRDSLLRAILLNPDENTPRLILADWLGEHGEPDRAEFIRLQCELAGKGYPGPLSLRAAMLESASSHMPAPGSPADRAHESCALLHRNAAWWLGDIFFAAGIEFVGTWGWSRGFVSEIHLPCAAFIAKGFAADLFRRQPIERVVLTDKRPLRRVHEGDEEWGWCFVELSWYAHYDVPFRWIALSRGRKWSNAWRLFDSEAEAMEDLNRMAIQWARNQAGLPAWAPATREVAA